MIAGWEAEAAIKKWKKFLLYLESAVNFEKKEKNRPVEKGWCQSKMQMTNFERKKHAIYG